jgi:hypothetical protein
MTASRCFQKDALKLIAEASEGIPRIINNLCFNAVSLCCALNRKQVDANMVAEAIADLQLSPQTGDTGTVVGDTAAEEPDKPKQRKPTIRRLTFWIPAAAAILILFACCPRFGSPDLGFPGQTRRPTNARRASRFRLRPFLRLLR